MLASKFHDGPIQDIVTALLSATPKDSQSKSSGLDIKIISGQH